MSELKDRLVGLQIRVTSPDGTVRGEATSKGVTIECIERIAEHHTEVSLAEQIELALVGMTDGTKRAREAVCDEFQNMISVNHSDDTDGKHRQRYRAALEEIDANGDSPRRFVSVKCFGTQSFRVDIARGTLARLGARTVAAEINHAIDKALSARARATVEVFKKIYMKG